jgi:hypothetical protein
MDKKVYLWLAAAAAAVVALFVLLAQPGPAPVASPSAPPVPTVEASAQAKAQATATGKQRVVIRVPLTRVATPAPEGSSAPVIPNVEDGVVLHATPVPYMEIEVEQDQTATSGSDAGAGAAVVTPSAPPTTPTVSGPRFGPSGSDLSDPTRWGLGVGVVRGLVFVDYQLVRQDIPGALPEASIDLQMNFSQVGAGVSVVIPETPLFVTGGLSLGFDGSGITPYVGAGGRIRF